MLRDIRERLGQEKALGNVRNHDFFHASDHSNAFGSSFRMSDGRIAYLLANRNSHPVSFQRISQHKITVRYFSLCPGS